jgi:hypothetical protein
MKIYVHQRPSVSFIISLLMLTATCISMPSQGQITLTPKRAYSYTDGVGVNTHLRYTHLPYYTAFETIIFPKLKQLGIKHVRDNFPHPSFLGSVSASLMRQRYLKLHDSCGIRYSYLVDSRRVIDTARFINSGEYLELFDTNPELIKTVQHFEGFNEPDRTIAVWFPSNWVSLTHTIQKSLWDKAHSMPALSHVSIINASPTHFGPSPSMPDSFAAPVPHISSYFDYANLHPYDLSGGVNSIFPGARYDKEQAYYDTIAKGKPFIVTEMGFPTARGFNNPAACTFGANSFHYSSELAAGKYYSIAFMELFKRGADRVYSYEFIDQNTADQGDVEKNFGLLRTDGSEKPAFTAIKNTLTILKDTSLSFSPAPLALTISGDTAGVRYSLYQKNNGRYYLALWLGVEKGPNFDYTTFTNIDVPAQQVKIELPYTAAVLNVYQPLLSDLPLHSYSSKDSLTVHVPDNLLLLEIAGPAEESPFTLINFDAVRDNGENVKLNWEARHETVNGLYQLEISGDGLHFQQIGEQHANSKFLSASKHKFDWKESSAAFYRLQYVDASGRTIYSRIRWVEGLKSLPLVAPNPFSSVFTIRLEMRDNISIYNSAGVLIKAQTLPAGSHQLDLGDKPTGLYYLKTGSGKSIKLMKQ